MAGHAAARIRGSGSEATVTELAELDGGSERTSADLVAVATDVDVDQPRLREALATGLFTSRGGDLLAFAFAHHTYGEFLAARFLHRHRFDVRRALELSPGRRMAASLSTLQERAARRLMDCRAARCGPTPGGL